TALMGIAITRQERSAASIIRVRFIQARARGTTLDTVLHPHTRGRPLHLQATPERYPPRPLIRLVQLLRARCLLSVALWCASRQVPGLFDRGAALVAAGVILRQAHVALRVDGVVIAPVCHRRPSNPGVEQSWRVAERIQRHESAIAPTIDPDPAGIHKPQ